ncbi:MAG TPA: hypothetical protein VKZ84_04735 [Bacteriovoracaceae bacterium]|nr:hypothetical protein [Bacteriovoracaceae bacterium]
MRLLVIFFFLLFLPQAYAWQYQLDEESLLHPSIFDQYEISQHFESEGLFSLSDTTLIKTGLPFDNAYLGYGLKQNLILKSGLVAPKHLDGVVIYEPSLDVHLIHFRVREIPYMVMGFNFSDSEFKKIIKPWLKIRKTSLLNLIIPSVYAESCELPGMGNELKSVSNSLSNQALLKKIGECGLEVLKGAKDNVSNTFDFFKKLATNPMELWQETKESFIQLKDFVLNINNELKEIFSNLGEMNLEDQLDIACHMSGHIFVSVAQSFFLGPAALARSLPLVVTRLKKMTAEVALAASLRKKGVKLPDNDKLVKEVIRCE